MVPPFAPLLSLALVATNLPPPLIAALRAAEDHSRALHISRAQLAEQEAQVVVALAGLTPTLQIQGQYIRNQYNGAVEFPSIGPEGQYEGLTTLTVQPYDQFQGTIGLNVPLLAPGAIARYAEGRHGSKASDHSERATELEVQLSVARAYYQVVAAQGILSAAGRALGTAQDALKVSRAKVEAGTANQLTVDRAAVDVARAQQTQADAVRTRGLARRSLETLTGVAVAEDFPAAEAAQPTATEEALVELAKTRRPEVLQAQESIAQAIATKNEAWTTLAPTLTGQAQEHLQNYGGFLYHEGYWTLGVNLNWTLDPVGSPGQIKKAQAAVDEQQARLEQVLDTVRDDVHSAWLDVQDNLAKSEETQAEVKSAREALTLTQDQFKVGTATSLDLSQAERDTFTAEANAAQAQSDLAASLLALERASGAPLLQM